MDFFESKNVLNRSEKSFLFQKQAIFFCFWQLFSKDTHFFRNSRKGVVINRLRALRFGIYKGSF